MLCYTFYENRLNEKYEEELGTEAFENIYDLFSMLLYILLNKQLKQGVYKNYNFVKDELKCIRGKINITDTIKNNSLSNRKIYIENYDENIPSDFSHKFLTKTSLQYVQMAHVPSHAPMQSPQSNLHLRQVLYQLFSQSCLLLGHG